ncbi:MAG: carbohydrate binding domain-containing protein [Armatimonadetes bacterium]|nr:carbohydrate binding domain-containing protein [Armatimonadota bacterium]
MVHFNNGLHSLGTDPKAWETSLRAAFDLLKAEGHGAKTVWATSTPLKDPDLTAKAQALNAVAAKVVAEYGFPTDDLFALMDPQDRNKLWTDTFHYNEQGRDMQAKQVADAVRPLLAGWVASAAASPVKNADFEGEGGWSLYPPKPENGSFELSTEGAHAGKRAAKVTVLQPGLQFHQYAPVLVAGATYTMKYWARAAQPSKLTVHVRTQKPPYVFYGNHTVDVTTDWQEFGTTFTLPADYKPGEHVLFFNLGTVGMCWIDDVMITP